MKYSISFISNMRIKKSHTQTLVHCDTVALLHNAKILSARGETVQSVFNIEVHIPAIHTETHTRIHQRHIDTCAYTVFCALYVYMTFILGTFFSRCITISLSYSNIKIRTKQTKIHGTDWVWLSKFKQRKKYSEIIHLSSHPIDFDREKKNRIIQYGVNRLCYFYREIEKLECSPFVRRGRERAKKEERNCIKRRPKKKRSSREPHTEFIDFCLANTECVTVEWVWDKKKIRIEKNETTRQQWVA